MPESMQFWEFVSIMAGLLVTLLTPTVWMIRNSAKNNRVLQDQLIEKINETSNKNHEHMRQDLTEFRQHFDASIENVYQSIKQNDKDLRDHITKQINEIKSFIAEMETRIEAVREHIRQNERDLLQFQKEVNQNFVTHQELDRFVEATKGNSTIKNKETQDGG